MSNVVSMADDGRALLQPHPNNQVVIEYPLRFNCRAMGENRAEVLQRIGVVANVRDIEVTEQADIMAVLSRFVYDDQGE